MTDLQALIDQLFDVQFLEGRYYNEPESGVVGDVTLSARDLAALKVEISRAAYAMCVHLECDTTCIDVQEQLAAALVTSWNDAPFRLQLKLPEWPWR